MHLGGPLPPQHRPIPRTERFSPYFQVFNPPRSSIPSRANFTDASDSRGPDRELRVCDQIAFQNRLIGSVVRSAESHIPIGGLRRTWPRGAVSTAALHSFQVLLLADQPQKGKVLSCAEFPDLDNFDPSGQSLYLCFEPHLIDPKRVKVRFDNCNIVPRTSRRKNTETQLGFNE